MRDSQSSRGSGRTLALLFLLVAIVAIAWIIWHVNNRVAFVDREPPGEPPQGEVEFAGSQPTGGFHLEEGDVLARTAFSTPGPANTQIEIRDLRFPPHVRTRLGALRGPGVIEVYSGQGTLSLPDKTEDLAGGVVKAVAAGQALEFDNKGDYSLVVRVYVTEGK